MYSLIIVEDEEKIRNGLKNLIDWNDMGFEVVFDFEDGSEALEFLKSNTVDIVLTDIKMNLMSGIDLAREIRQRKLDTHIIFLSGFKEFEYARNAIEYNVENYLLKPVKLNELYKVFSTLKDKLDASKAEKKAAPENSKDNLLPHLVASKKVSGHVVQDNSLLDNVILEKYPNNLEFGQNKLLECIFQGDTKAVENIIYHIIDDFISIDINESNVKNSLIGFIHGIIEKINENLAEDKKMQKFDYSQIYLVDNLVQVRLFIVGYFFNVATFFKNNRPGTERLLIQKIKDYIKLHYSDEISLNSAAEYVFISPTYCSRIFKEYTGENFIDYLTNIRIGKAKVLLESMDAKVYEVAEKIGYKSQKYFSKLFKKCTGMSPTDYQNSKGC